jgi:ADP-ribosylglycohydrolase
MIEVDALKNITLGDRCRGAVWGQFVGDAAALGTHWIYDLTELQQLYPAGINGFEMPAEGHYHFGKKPGDQTHYGDGALVLLESLAQEGRFDAKAFGRSFIRAFRPGVYSGYIDRATRGTLENFEALREV